MNILLGLLTHFPSLTCCHASCSPGCEWTGVVSVVTGWSGSRGAGETHNARVELTGGRAGE